MGDLGLKVLSSGESPVSADVVFVHGLRGHRTETWTSKDGVLWPEKLLKCDLPNARIMTWGYDAQVMNFFATAGQSSIAMLSRQLLEDLAVKRRTADEKERAIVFVAHSLGGLVVKDALYQSYAESRSEPVYHPRIASIKGKTVGVVFAGTPHRGASKAKWGVMATNMARLVFHDNNPTLVTALSRGSETIERLQNDFSRIGMTLRIKTFFEDYCYPSVGKIVDNDSASLGFPNESMQVIPGNHVEMVKFANSEDTGYERMSNAIRELIEDGPMEVNRGARVLESRAIYAIAISTYTAQSEMHITFRKDDIIRNVRFISREFWKGSVSGKAGLFPRNLVEIYDSDASLPSPTIEAPVPRTWKRASFVPAPTTSAPTLEIPIRGNVSRPPIGQTPVDPSSRAPSPSPSPGTAASRDQLEAFWISVEEGHYNQVERQIQRGVDVNAIAKAGDCISQYGTALVTAVSRGHEEIVRLLLKNGARPNQPGNPNSVCLPLHTAAYLGHVKIVKILLGNGASVVVQGGCYRFALTAAAAGGRTRIMGLLLERGAVVNARDLENETALHGAVAGGSLEAVQWLLTKGIDRDVRGEQGTALELSLELEKGEPGSRADIIELLSQGKIKPAKPALSVHTKTEEEVQVDKLLSAYIKVLLAKSLLLSARDGDLEDVRTLLAGDDGADPNERCPGDDDYGYPLHAACANGRIIVVQLLLESGADVHAEGGQLGQALHFSVFFGYPFIAKLLVAWGADVNRISGTTGLSALQIAAKKGHTECMKVLLDNGADINFTRGPLGSPLHAAASASYAATELLLSRGANPRVVDEKGLTAADRARAFQQYDAERLLVHCGSQRTLYVTLQPTTSTTTIRSLSFSLNAAQQQAVRREQAISSLIDQYAALLQNSRRY